MLSYESALQRAITRLWQPRRVLFWLVLAFNALSSLLAWSLHLLKPGGSLLVVLAVLALANAAMGWWMLALLWREGAPPATSTGKPHGQSTARREDR